MQIRPLIGLLGVLIAALTSEFNDQVTSIALVDVRGGLGISSDAGTWLTSLYATGQVIGMGFSPWWAVTTTVRRWALGSIALCCVITLCIPWTANLTLLYGLRLLQGFSGGLLIPLLLVVGLRVLGPPIRLYGLAAYALTTTFGPNMATTLAALWTDIVDWHFVFLETLPLCAISAVLVWYGVQQDPPQYQRLRQFDWRGSLLIVIGFGAFTTMLEQGDRYDWFNSQTICVLALVSVVALPLLVVNEVLHPLPLFGFFLLKRRNIAYALIALVTFLLLNLSSSTLPLTFLTSVAGYRPLQSQLVTLQIALAQLVMLPAIAVLLNFERVDARVVSFVGMACVLAACLGNVLLTSVVQGGGFLVWQGFEAVGQPMIIMPLLMMATNSIRKPEEGPLGSGLINSSRGLAEPISVWLLQLIMRWRGGLHYNRIVDQSGQGRYSVIQGRGLIPGNGLPLQPDGQPAFPGSLELFSAEVRRQATVLTISDAFLVVAGLTVALMVVLLVLPVRTYPPRIALAKK